MDLFKVGKKEDILYICIFVYIYLSGISQDVVWFWVQTAKNLELMSQVQKVMAGQSEALFGSQNTTNFSSQPSLPTSFQRSAPGNNNSTNNTNNSMMQQLSPGFRSLSPIRQAQKLLQDVNWPTFELNYTCSTILSLTDQNMRRSVCLNIVNESPLMNV